MTHPPPPDPLWQPSLPPPDPVLQPPTPLPWEQPAQPSSSSSQLPAAAPPVPSPARARPTWSTAATTTPTWQPEPVRPKSWNWSVIGSIAAALVICGGILASGIGLGRIATQQEPVTVAPVTPRSTLPHSPAVSFGAPVAIVDGGPTSSFDLPVGTGVRFSDPDGTWSVALLGVEWIDDCDDVLGSTVPVVVFDIRYDVTEGAVSIIPLTDFALVLANGTTARVGLLPTCAEPALEYTIISAGTIRRGRIAVELPSGVDGMGGELTYGQLGVPTASWIVPKRVG